MGFIQNKFASVMPPVQGSSIQRAHSATAVRLEVLPAWKGELVTFWSVTSNAYVAFGDAGVMASAAAVATVTGETVAPHWASGAPVLAGSYMNIYCPPNATHFTVDSDAASGYWGAYLSSSDVSLTGENLPSTLGNPALWLDAAVSGLITQSSASVSRWTSRVKPAYSFTEGTNYPDWVAAPSAAALIRPTIDFTAAGSEKLTSTNTSLAALVGSTSSFTLAMAFSRGATAAAHTLFSCGTDGSANGRWDVTLDASDDLVITRVTSGGASTTSTYTGTVSAAAHVLVVTFDGSTPLAWLDRTSVSLTGTAAGDVGTVTRVGIGCRTYNTSTHDQFLTGEISEVLLWSSALSSNQVTDLHAWLKRRYGV